MKMRKLKVLGCEIPEEFASRYGQFVLDRIQEEVEDELRNKARNKIAAELRGARRKLQEVRAKSRDVREDFLYAQEDLANAQRAIREARAIAKGVIYSAERVANSEVEREHLLAEVPEPFVEPSKWATGLPDAPGIYFFWEDGVVVYVGQSVRLSARVRLGSHERLKQTDMISYIPCEKGRLDSAEWFYIWLLRPARNFGGKFASMMPITAVA